VQIKVQSGCFDHRESGQRNSEKVRKILGENCTLDQSQLEQLTDGIYALADFVVTAFVEQRKLRKTTSEQPALDTFLPLGAAV